MGTRFLKFSYIIMENVYALLFLKTKTKIEWKTNLKNGASLTKNFSTTSKTVCKNGNKKCSSKNSIHHFVLSFKIKIEKIKNWCITVNSLYSIAIGHFWQFMMHPFALSFYIGGTVQGESQCNWIALRINSNIYILVIMPGSISKYLFTMCQWF